MTEESTPVVEKKDPYRRLDAFSLHPVVGKGGKGQVPFRFDVDGTLVDLVLGDENTRIDKIMIGGQTYATDGSWKEFFERTRVEVAKSRRLIAVAVNKADEQRPLALSVIVLPGAVSATAQQKVPRTVAPLSKRIHKSENKRKNHRPAGAVRQKTKKELVMVLPNDGEKAVLLIRGHAHGLQRMIEHRVPLHHSFTFSLARQLDQAAVRDGAVSVGGNEIVACLPTESLAPIAAGLRRNNIVLDPLLRTRVLRALNEGIMRVIDPVTGQDPKTSKLLPAHAAE